MAVRIHFAGLVPGRPLVMLAWAAHAKAARLTEGTVVHYGRELADVFDNHWRISARLEDSDVVVYPHSYEDGSETAKVAEAARAAGKPCIFYSQDERLPPSTLTYGTLYRSSIFKKLGHERAHPVFIYDLKAESQSAFAETLAKQDAPEIGFCGYVGTPLSRLGLRLLGANQKVDGLAFRARVLNAVKLDSRLRSRFVARASYLGAAPLAAFQGDHPLAEERMVFLSNLYESPYALAMRGKGNHSVRFYEILSAGRIPLFVNTGCVLPLENEINWKEHTVWVEDSELSHVGDRVLAFHNRVDPEAFRDLQRRNRRLWEERLQPEPYFRHVLETVAKGGKAP